MTVGSRMTARRGRLRRMDDQTIFETYPGACDEFPRQYMISESDRLVATFTTGVEPDGRSAHEVAVGNLIGYTHDLAGVYTLTWLPPCGAPVDLCEARDGVGTLLVDQDDVSADSMFGRGLTPAERARAAWTIRHGLDAPTMWGDGIAS